MKKTADPAGSAGELGRLIPYIPSYQQLYKLPGFLFNICFFQPEFVNVQRSQEEMLKSLINLLRVCFWLGCVI